MKKITVYGINYENNENIKKWLKIVKDADSIYILDFSNDKNVENLLIYNGIKIIKISEIFPMNSKVTEVNHVKDFSFLYNSILKIVKNDKSDIYVRNDTNIIFENGWREKLENSWKNSTKLTCIEYKNLKNGEYKILKKHSKIHNEDYIWSGKIYEELKYSPKNEKNMEKVTENFNLKIYNISSVNKNEKINKHNSQVKILEEVIITESKKLKILYNLTRKYLIGREYEKIIKVAKTYLKIDECYENSNFYRAKIMSNVARAFYNLNDKILAYRWFCLSVIEDKYTLENYYSFAEIAARENDLAHVYFILDTAFTFDIEKYNDINYAKIREKMNYLLSKSYFWLERYHDAKKYLDRAIISGETKILRKFKKEIKNKLRQEKKIKI